MGISNKVILQEEKRLLEELLYLLDSQYDFLLDKDTNNLAIISAKIEDITIKIEAIEMKKREVYDYNNGDEELVLDIKNTLVLLEKQKELNMKITRQNLFFINKIINIVTSEKSNKTYNINGQSKNNIRY